MGRPPSIARKPGKPQFVGVMDATPADHLHEIPDLTHTLVVIIAPSPGHLVKFARQLETEGQKRRHDFRLKQWKERYGKRGRRYRSTFIETFSEMLAANDEFAVFACSSTEGEILADEQRMIDELQIERRGGLTRWKENGARTSISFGPFAFQERHSDKPRADITHATYKVDWKHGVMVIWMAHALMTIYDIMGGAARAGGFKHLPQWHLLTDRLSGDCDVMNPRGVCALTGVLTTRLGDDMSVSVSTGTEEHVSELLADNFAGALDGMLSGKLEAEEVRFVEALMRLESEKRGCALSWKMSEGCLKRRQPLQIGAAAQKG